MERLIGNKENKEELTSKESILEKQKRLANQKDFLKDKFKNVNEGQNPRGRTVIKKDDISNHLLLPDTVSHAQQLPSIPASSGSIKISNGISGSVSKNQQSPTPANSTTAAPKEMHKLIKTKPILKSSDGSLDPCRPSFNEKLNQSACNGNGMPSTTQDHKKNQPYSSQPPISSIKYSKSSNINTKKNKCDRKREKHSNKKSTRRTSKHNVDKHFFSTSIIDDYFNKAGNKSFSLPPDEYKELMKAKASIKDLQTSASKLIDCKSPGNLNKKCFYQTTPLLEARDDDGPIIDCHIDHKNLILIQRDAINIYERKDSKSKEWCFKKGIRRIRFSDIIKEMIVQCTINKKEMLVFCQIHLAKDDVRRKTLIKMAQYCFLDDTKKEIKEYLLGSFDCCLEKLRCCHIAKRPCCIAISGWNVARSRTVGWVFTHTEVNDIMRCGAMIPLKHEVESLHDISMTPHKNVLLAFGGSVFTIWNAKTGERLSCCSLENISLKSNIVCHFGCFATIQKGFLFILANTGDKLHMIATNLDTEVSKSLRKFKIPRDDICAAVSVKDDKLVGITDKSIICWSLKNTLRIQQLRLNEGNKTFLIKNKILITTGNNLRKILTVKSDTHYRAEMASKMKELISSESVDNEEM